MDSPEQNEIDSELRCRAHKICREHLGGAWGKITPDEMSITPISGGMSNLLYCCSLPESIKLSDGEPLQALLRLYGDQSRNSEISVQVRIFELLSLKELGPKLYGIFDEGRLEEFLPAESLTSDELMNSEISSIIARKLARVHSLDVPDMNKKDNWLLERFHEWSEFLNNQKKSPTDYANGIISESTLKIAEKLMAIDFEQEIKHVRQIIDNIRSPIVFSHNDLHQGNILLAKPTKRRSILDQRVMLIDFEYCSYNYRAYDIANHFCEWCFEYDTTEYPHFAVFENRFPSIDIQRGFVRNYLDQQKKLSKASVVSDQEVEKIIGEIKPFCMAAHLVWTLWCIKRAYLSSIKFGYWEHAWSRWQLYLGLKRSHSTARKRGKVEGIVASEPSSRRDGTILRFNYDINSGPLSSLQSL